MATKAEVGSAAAEIDEALEEENVKLPKAIQGIWIQADDQGNMLSTTPVVLDKTKKGKKGRFQGITFNNYHRPWGRWLYTFVDSTGLLEFEARGLAAARGRPQVLYRFYPKHHLFLHVVEEQPAQSGNPALSWCYGDESAIGDAIKVAESGHAATLHRLVMVKYRS